LSKGLAQRLRLYSELLKLEHTIFALPFVLSSILLLMKELPSPKKILFIVLSAVFARTLGMALNRLLDLPYDAQNPRTKVWPHASGLVKKPELLAIIVLSGSLFVLTCALINRLALMLSPIVILLLIFYPLAKRLTYFPHFVLGLVYFLIPLAVDVALNERISTVALLLGLAMSTWVSGFDILYSLQDYEFDQKVGLKSIPVRFGIVGAIRFARVLHFLTFLSLLLLAGTFEKTPYIYLIGLLLLSMFLIYEHRLIKPHDLSKLNKAFFTVNGWISVLFFFVVLLEKLLNQ
jgi:4-hydroxybenzoate polyprenyltransferase